MLPPLLTTVVDMWIGRARRVEPAAVAAIARLRPAMVVVGGSEGIGFAIAARAVRTGCALVLIARTAEELSRARDRIAAGQPRATVTTLPLDVTGPDATTAIDRHLATAGYYLDRLVIAAGVGSSGPFEAADSAEIDRLTALNVAATTRLVRWALPGMLARGSGGILAIGSLGGLAPGPYQAAYYASKAYLQSLIVAIAQENRGRGVRLSVVIPGPVDTRFHEKMNAQSAWYRRVMPSMTAAGVASSALRGHALGQTVIRPGAVTPVLAFAMRVLPHPLLVPVIGWLLKPRGD